DPDAVLARDAPAERDARLEDLPPGGEDTRHLVPIALVEEEDRVDVAVAGVEDVGDTQAVALGSGRDAPEDLGDARARYDSVLRAVVRRQTSDRAEGALATLPEGGAFGVIAGGANFAGSVLSADGAHALRQRVEAGRRAVELDQQDGARLGWEADAKRRLDGLDDEP